jgi:hypothetical protein
VRINHIYGKRQMKTRGRFLPLVALSLLAQSCSRRGEVPIIDYDGASNAKLPEG